MSAGVNVLWLWVLSGGLHAQVAAFARAAGPDQADVDQRDFIYRKIATSVKRLYPGATVEVFGGAMMRVVHSVDPRLFKRHP